MQIRCYQCHKPFAIGKDMVHEALDAMVEEDMNHYNVHCPHCGKTSKVSKAELARAAPDWTKKEAVDQSEEKE
jgi:DNA-directed RNA polymerase subunit RPC12/RpoP